MNFKIIKKSKLSKARLGLIESAHGIIETPSLIPVATQAVVKTLTSEETEQTKSQAIIANAFHLHLRPGENVIKKAKGLHSFINWKKPLMTDSGGFQVFSLGFGGDFTVGKILKKQKNEKKIKIKSKPKNIKITQDGVFFKSFIDGKELFLGPKESIAIQEALGADIIFTFDECTAPLADYEYTSKSLQKTHAWAKICLDFKKSKQAIYGIIQGGRYKNLRIESAKFIGGMEFDGFGIGGEFGNNKKTMINVINWVIKELPEKKPRHLLGIGHLNDIEKIIKAGVDTFDCTIPTHYARRGIAFTSERKLNLNEIKFLKKREFLDKNCLCQVCLNYRKDYICHLIRARELTAFKLITFHNLWYFNSLVEQMRQKIKQGKI